MKKNDGQYENKMADNKETKWQRNKITDNKYNKMNTNKKIADNKKTKWLTLRKQNGWQ